MDDATLQSLKDALAATPDNQRLRLVLVGALLDRGDADGAFDLVRDIAADDLASEEDRLAAARACLEAEEPERGLDFAAGDSPEAGILRARCLLALEREAEGRDAYAEAVARNPTLEDRELRALLFANVAESEGRSGPRLRVISNDDTDADELDRVLEPAQPRATFADVGGLDAVKEQIRRKIILPYQKPSLFKSFKKRLGGGILMYGPPGCGKTLLARATAGECEAEFLNVAISDVLDMYIGESERKLHALFQRARTKTPSVLFFDELEALGGKRQYSREGTSSKLVSQFLSEMDGFAQDNKGVLVLGATNVPWAVDPAFRRPGRFDRVLFVPPPDRQARETILKLLLADRPLANAIDTGFLVSQTSGFSGADLENVVETAADLAIEASLDAGAEVPLDDGLLLRALKEVKPTTVEWLSTARNYARYANEAGQYDDVLAFLDKHGAS